MRNIEKSEWKTGTLRAREIAGADATGVALGNLGLMVFAVVVWRCMPCGSMAVVLSAATLSCLLAIRDDVDLGARTGLLKKE